MGEVGKTFSQINISESILAILAIVFGILIIAFPWLIAYIIGTFLIVEGILLLIKYVEKQRRTTNEQ